MNRILLVDDHATLREPVAFMFEREPEFAMVAQAGSLAEARGMLDDLDVAVIDLDLPDGNGEELIKDFHIANPRGTALVLTATADRRVHARAIEAGAAGILHKSVRVKEVVDAVRCLLAGEELLSPNETVELLRLASREREQNYEAQRAIARLTPREREVLQALADGLRDKDIAHKLQVGSGTIRNHVASILGKLDVQSRLQALVFAVRHGATRID